MWQSILYPPSELTKREERRRRKTTFYQTPPPPDWKRSWQKKKKFSESVEGGGLMKVPPSSPFIAFGTIAVEYLEEGEEVTKSRQNLWT